MPVVLPPSLHPGDTIAICSPAGAVDNVLFEPAIARIEAEGYRVKEMPHCRGKFGYYSGTIEQRAADMAAALTDSEVKCIICGRGGFGAVELLPSIEQYVTSENAKWIVGFSDITVLHALMQKCGIASIHASMLKSLASADAEAENAVLFSILRGEKFSLELAPHPASRCGIAEGILAGGNLSIISSLMGTPYDILRPGVILFIEDVNEPIYKIKRMLSQLRLAGVLQSLSALVVGQFTGAKADANFSHPYEMIQEMTVPYGYPVIFGAPIGHSGPNMPIIEGFPCRLTPTSLSQL